MQSRCADQEVVAASCLTRETACYRNHRRAAAPRIKLHPPRQRTAMSKLGICLGTCRPCGSRRRYETFLARSNRSTCTISRGGTPSARVGRARALLRRQNRKEKSQTGINSSGCEKDGEFCGFI